MWTWVVETTLILKKNYNIKYFLETCSETRTSWTVCPWVASVQMCHWVSIFLKETKCYVILNHIYFDLYTSDAFEIPPPFWPENPKTRGSLGSVMTTEIHIFRGMYIFENWRRQRKLRVECAWLVLYCALNLRIFGPLPRIVSPRTSSALTTGTWGCPRPPSSPSPPLQKRHRFTMSHGHMCASTYSTARWISLLRTHPLSLPLSLLPPPSLPGLT